jgi:hypothetical protein
MPSPEKIRQRLRDYEPEQAVRLAADPPKPSGRPQTAQTRKLLSRAAFERHRRNALSKGCHPLRRARLTLDGQGLTIDALAERALVGSSLIQKAEQGQRVSGMTLKRLARALNTSPGMLR